MIMDTVQQTTNETDLNRSVDIAPVNENMAPVVPLARVDDLQSTTANLRQQLTNAAVEAVRRVPDGTVEIRSEAPAIIVRRSIGEAINRRDLRPGQILRGAETGDFVAQSIARAVEAFNFLVICSDAAQTHVRA
jgi:hypothetical protein